MMTHDTQPIVAQCSGKGPGAIGLIRISGNGSIQIGDSIGKLADNKKLADHLSHTIHYGKITDAHGKTIDTVLFLLMRGPKTFTGQDTVEITCHNNPFLIEAIINQAIQKGARPAQQGEFSQRAVINKKIDMIQAEAINDLIHAHTQEALKRSLCQLEGTLSYEISSIEKKLVKALAFSEASFEFIDEEDLTFAAHIKKLIQSVLNKITYLKQAFAQQKQIREGVRIAFIGSVNAGKSSLFNTLLGSNRAIVTEQPGTTRDVIEAGLTVNGVYWTLIDTAGIRSTHNMIEAEGIERSYKEAHTADIILLIIDGSRTLTPQEVQVYFTLLEKYPQKSILVSTKADLASVAQPIENINISISSKDSASIKALKGKLEQKIARLLKAENAPYLLTQRQHRLLSGLTQTLERILPFLEGESPYELISHHLQEAIANIGELTGKTISEQAMNAVFREFCVGK